MKKLQAFFAILLKYARQLPGLLGEHILPSFLVLVLVSLIISGVVFYLTVFSLRNVEPDIQGSLTEFKQDTFQDIQDIWQERSLRLKEADEKTHENLFEAR